MKAVWVEEYGPYRDVLVHELPTPDLGVHDVYLKLPAAAERRLARENEAVAWLCFEDGPVCRAQECHCLVSLWNVAETY